MKFSELSYSRPDINALSKQFSLLLTEFNNTENAEEHIKIIDSINKIRNTFETFSSIASVKYTQDTTNTFNQEEQNYFDQNGPVFTGLVVDLYNTILKSKHKPTLEKHFGKQLFSIAQMSVDTFKKEVLEDLQKENRLASEYTKLLSSAKIEFKGNQYNLSEIATFIDSSDREERKQAQEAKYKYFVKNASEFDRLFDELVKLRTSIAQKLGYKNFTELGYKRMLRGDYNAAMVAEYREQVRKHIVPLTTKLKDRQLKRLGLDKLKYYDEALGFKSGNANPKGNPEWIVDNATKMYEELSPETGEFIHFMVDNEMMDLVSRKGKAPGGYCTFFSEYKSPFIFSNFNGTSHDIIVLTHEAGHAFQGYSSRNFNVPEYYFPTYEACEIHSMSMEFITWPWMDLFFLEDTDKFKFSHVSKALSFLPYGVAVDEFQHWVYENYKATPKERNNAWREIEKKYIPFRDYDGNSFLEQGGFWQQQAHIYKSPFYYIDYTLAQICAFQFWKKATEDRKKTMENYIRLCKAGGSKSFLELVDLANLISPFKSGCLETVAKDVNGWLETIDDRKL